MERIKRKLVTFIFIVLSLTLLAGKGWAQQIELPHAFFNGLMQTYLDNGVDDDLLFMYTTINTIVYADGTLETNPANDSILGKTLVITGAKRTAGTTFTDATLSISDGVTTYFTATLINIEFELIDGLWRLNPDLDVNDPPTLNMIDIVLNPGPAPSQYILDLQAQLGSQDIAGMKMTLSTFSGDISGDSQSGILEGLLDGVSAVTPNEVPVADAGLTTTSSECLTSSCEVILDGTQSSDTDGTIETYSWYNDSNMNGIPEASELIATGSDSAASVMLPLGMYQIILVVIDNESDASAVDENGVVTDPNAIITVVIDPAELAFIEIDKAHVKKDGKIKIYGRLALPAGVSHLNINSVGSVDIGLSNPLITAISESVDFTERADGNKWKYSESPALGIKHFKIDWKGSKFSYADPLHNLNIKTHHIGDDRTTLEIQTCAAITININGTDIIIDEEDNVSCSHSGAKIDRDNDGDSDDSDSDQGRRTDDDDGDCRKRVRLPFALTPDMVITISGSYDDSISVGDYLTAAVGKFKIHARYDSSAIDFYSLEPELELTVTLGDEGFNGTLVIDSLTWTKIKSKHWKYRRH